MSEYLGSEGTSRFTFAVDANGKVTNVRLREAEQPIAKPSPSPAVATQEAPRSPAVKPSAPIAPPQPASSNPPIPAEAAPAPTEPAPAAIPSPVEIPPPTPVEPAPTSTQPSPAAK